jgi:hypothetical protein
MSVTSEQKRDGELHIAAMMTTIETCIYRSHVCTIPEQKLEILAVIYVCALTIRTQISRTKRRCIYKEIIKRIVNVTKQSIHLLSTETFDESWCENALTTVRDLIEQLFQQYNIDRGVPPTTRNESGEFIYMQHGPEPSLPPANPSKSRARPSTASCYSSAAYSNSPQRQPFSNGPPMSGSTWHSSTPSSLYPSWDGRSSSRWG